ncbi:MAG: M1 family metallopeptidase [Bacillota bacterium]
MLRHRRLLWLLLLLPLLAVPFLLQRPAAAVVFLTETHGNVTLHRPIAMRPTQTQALVTAAEKVMGQQSSYGRIDKTERLDVWVVPDKANWPAGLARPPVDAPIRAAGPFAIVSSLDGLITPEASGLEAAVALAVTQPAGSPAFAVPWLYHGMAEVWRHDLTNFPAGYYRETGLLPLDAAAMLGRLELAQAGGSEVDEAAYRQAAAALAAFLMDRWGVDWPRHGRIGADDLRPLDALTWTTGVADRQGALGRWQERMRTADVRGKKTWIPSLAEISPVRAQPALGTLPPGPGARPNVSPHAYQIHVKYEPARRELTGSQVVHWQNGESIPVDTLYFNLWANAEQFALYGGHIAVQRVTVDGGPVPFTARGLDLTVPLGGAIKPGEGVAVAIDFTTRLPGSIPFRLFGQTGYNRFNLVHWYPQLAVLDDRGWNLLPFPTYPGEPYHETADYQVTLDVPAGTQLGATGRLVARREQDDRWIYEYDAPQVRDWAAAGGRGLVERVTQADSVRVQVLHTEQFWVDQVSMETVRALELFHQRFGPYPYSDLVVSCCSGIEYPGLFFTYPINPANESWRIVVYHELAHQWFYGLIGNDQYTEPWLDEAFARYGDRLASRTFGAPVAPPATNRFLPAGLRTSSSSREYAAYPADYGRGVYIMGADTLAELEREIGPELFDRLIRQWVERYRFQIVTTADFVALAEEISGRELNQFFAERGILPSDRAVYRPLIPWP